VRDNFFQPKKIVEYISFIVINDDEDEEDDEKDEENRKGFLEKEREYP